MEFPVMDYLYLLIAAWVVVAMWPNSDVTQAINEFKPEKALGGAGLAGRRLLKKLLGNKGIPIGFFGGRQLRYNGQGHLLTVCAARGGKGVSLLIPAMIDWAGSLFVIDPKAENACVTAHGRRRYGSVFILNPFGLWKERLQGIREVRYNPMDLLDPKSAAFHVDCDKIATAVITPEEGRNRYFTDAAKVLVSGVIAALRRYAPPDKQNLVEVARIISDGEGLFDFCREAAASSDPFIIQKLKRFAIKAEERVSEEVRSVVATAISNLAFLGNEAIAASLQSSNFRFADLKRKPGTTVYICLPLSKLDVTDKYFRLLLESFLMEMLNTPKGKPVLAIIDEMAQVGPYMKSLENAQGMISGAAGLIIWGVLQSLVQLQGMSPKSWQTFIQNAGVTMWFGERDLETQEFVSKLSGTAEVISRSQSANIDRQTGNVVLSESGTQHSRPVLLPHEVRDIAPDEMAMFVEGIPGTIMATRKPYWKIGRYAGRYRDNPYFTEGG